MANRTRWALVVAISLISPKIRCEAQHKPPDSMPAAAATQPLKQEFPQYRYYAGIQAAAKLLKVTSATYPIQEAVVRPLYGFVGYYLTPRLAIQAGFLQRDPPSEKTLVVSFNSAGQPVENSASRNQYDAEVPVVLRYDLARRPVHRLYTNALVGVSLLFHYYQTDEVASLGGKVVYEIHEYSRTHNWYLMAGASTGYRLMPHVDLLMEATANRNLTASDYAATARKISFGVGAGLRYRFDL